MYVCGFQLSEANREKCFNFTGSGRPSHYVPVKVPLLDEVATRQQANIWRYGLLDGTIDPVTQGFEPDPIYRWVYRPEMQFTVYEFNSQSILAERATNTDSVTETVELVNDATPVIGSDILSVALVFDLLTDQIDILDMFEPDRELIFAFGEHEVGVSVGADQQITFDNLDHLSALEPEDFLTLSLFANGDSANVLWEFAFKTMDVDLDSDNDNGLANPDRSDEEERLESLNVGKVFAVNDGDINGNDIPDYAEFSYGEMAINFVPIIVELPLYVNLETTQITFDYFGSDPNQMDIFTSAETLKSYYNPGDGGLRIWFKDGVDGRDSMPRVNSSTDDYGGDYIRPHYAYDAKSLGFSKDANVNLMTRVFYMEAVRVSQYVGDTRIKVVVKNN